MYSNCGYIEFKKGEYVGELSIDGVNISPIVGYYFKDGSQQWLWLKRKRVLEYDIESGNFKTRNPSPMFEVYMEKHKSPIAYKGTFVFFKFKYNIVGIWDERNKDKQRLNFTIERCPNAEQNIIKRINDIRNERGN